ncbi:alkylhydroperoxidase domain protein [Nesterenkonia ebinurensis]|uniref:alkylhydroperoxidase domain protein n=1 Tax=Nesterenkonia ebinurensis TaxID=2608252 RepID=UPI00168AE175|nr:alkylhydroperoxidase domain protein [Nesterenkonia ebinurensis]
MRYKSAQILEYENEITRPARFTQETLGWVPWLAPIPEEELTQGQREALIDDFRIKRPYFRLLVRNAAALEARTLTDKDIFQNEEGGLPLEDRELAATAASRLNGCVYCASVHSRKASHYSGRKAEIQQLLDEGADADLDPRWSAISHAAQLLTRSPLEFGPDQVSELYRVGLDESEIVDLVYSASFFNWANRLMLALGEPEVLSRRRRS